MTTNQQAWEDLGELDPYWATITAPEMKFRKDAVDTYFRTGTEEIAGLTAAVERLGYATRGKAALDFGCGLGRLTRALSARFERCWGIDIAESMIRRAAALNQEYPNCTFVQRSENDLALFQDCAFDLIYSNVVLEHLPSRRLIKQCIRELVRVLHPDGILVFQLPSKIPLSRRLQPRRRLYGLLRFFGAPQRALYERFGLHPIRLLDVAESEVKRVVTASGAVLVHLHPDTNAGPGIESRTYYVSKTPRR